MSTSELSVGTRSEGLPALDLSTLTVNLGLYDPDNVFAQSEIFAIDHAFLAANSYHFGEVVPFLSTAAQRGRWPLVTAEPWGDEGRDPESLFDDILSGRYDGPYSALCTDLDASPNPVFVRWGHEMDNVTGRYPWAQRDAHGYIAAYQHFVDLCRQETDNAYYVWSPVGHSNLADYWPGREYADYVGLSVYGFPEYEEKTLGEPQTFREIFGPRYERVKEYDRPVMIAEMGVHGDELYRLNWLNDALASTPDYPLLKTMVFFNAPEHEGVWGDDVSTPDWRLGPGMFDL